MAHTSRSFLTSLPAFLVACCLLTTVLPLPADADQPIVFNRDIRPLFTEHCFRCHGPDGGTREAGLRFDLREAAMAELDSGSRAIVPGQPNESELLTRVSSNDPDLRMPPADSGKALTPDQQHLLRRWIDAGAEYAPHWSFEAPRRPELPEVTASTPNPIDRFVLACLATENIEPAKPANRYRLARRVALALTGLPLSLDATEAFANDTSPDAYEKLVDRLMASPRFGERWARVWLDLARYADSAGYAQDPPRSIWRYRDWVIGAINRNLTYDQFTMEQLAGDMLPSPTTDQLLATAFHRNTMTNSEGGTDDEEFRSAAVVDRVNTTMQVWMGLTIGCAQCHDHKYDPISQQEYYEFYAIFNNTADADRGDESPTLTTLSREEQQRRARLADQIADLEKQIAADPRPKSSEEKPSGTLKTRFIRIDLPGQKQFLSLAEVQAFMGQENVALQGTASQSSTAFDGPASLAIDGNTDGNYAAAKSTTHTQEEKNPWWQVDLGQPKSLNRIALWNRTDGAGDRLQNVRVVLSDADGKAFWIHTIDAPPNPSIQFTVPADFSQVSDEQWQAAMGYRRSQPVAISAAQQRLAALRKRREAITGTSTPILRELPADKQRKTHIHVRGNFMVKGTEVHPGTPRVFPSLPDANRLGMAKWLVSRKNPLTARVVVNRYWEQLFGVGLVATSEDFGSQGAPPSHPVLLDYLAVELMTHHWDTKWLLREIVTSATYRQSAAVTPELLARDPNNRLLARGPRFRLDAEMVRDQALALAGLLSDKMLGRSVRPPQPKLGLRAAFGGNTDWDASGGEDRFRRGLYTSWRRTTPYPSLMTFDAPSREFCTVRRIRTNTPLQALVTLNDPVFVEAARALARRIMNHRSCNGGEPRTQAAYGLRLCAARPPAAAEVDRLEKLFRDARAKFARDRESARLITRVGEEHDVPANPDEILDLAAWTVVSNVLLNLDEVLVR